MRGVQYCLNCSYKSRHVKLIKFEEVKDKGKDVPVHTVQEYRGSRDKAQPRLGTIWR